MNDYNQIHVYTDIYINTHGIWNDRFEQCNQRYKYAVIKIPEIVLTVKLIFIVSHFQKFSSVSYIKIDFFVITRTLASLAVTLSNLQLCRS